MLGIAPFKPDGRPLTARSALARWAILDSLTVPSWIAYGVIGPEAFVVVGAVGFVWWLAIVASVVSHPARRGYHDRGAGSVVYRTDDVALRTRQDLSSADL